MRGRTKKATEMFLPSRGRGIKGKRNDDDLHGERLRQIGMGKKRVFQ